MRRIRYMVATSLDGYIAGPKGEADWIVPDRDTDFLALFKQFDTVLLGRRTYEMTRARVLRRDRRASACTFSRGRSGKRTIRQ
jgi:dihydrofolate reductase